MIGREALIDVYRAFEDRLIQAPPETAVELLAAEEGINPDELAKVCAAIVCENWRAEANMLDPEAGVGVLTTIAVTFFLQGRMSVKQPVES
jgi:hypothetical protein